MRTASVFVCFVLGLCAPAYAESPSAPAVSWGRFDVQSATLSTRYRFIETYPISNRTRVDAVVTYDLLSVLHRNRAR